MRHDFLLLAMRDGMLVNDGMRLQLTVKMMLKGQQEKC